MVVYETGQQNRKHLSQRHDDCEDDWAEARDSLEDEQLSGGGTDGEDNAVEQKLFILEHEQDRGEEIAASDEGPDGEETGEQVHPEHHLD